ncbi:unnamed protein product [Amaranthus hypochondriacus]
MADIASTSGNMEKLNNNNYTTWSIRMQFYLLGQDLLGIVGGGDTTVPTDVEESKKWKIKAGKAMYVLAATVEDELLHRIKDAKTPKESWDTLSGLFSKKNDAQLQMLENELTSIQQNKLTVNQYFTKVKTLCEQITKLDPENPITETRMRRIIVRGLKPSLNGLVTAIRGWATQPTLIEFENVLANQEALDNQMSGVSIKKEDTALFGNKIPNKSGEKIRQSSNPLPDKSNQRSGGFRKARGKRGYHQGGARDRQ